ncbi:DNA polymerase I [Candidatus Magnetoovum chiemensis]|nr:DNA polymerase I [Candidatus Magnetoovum chiemensis]
MDIYLIDGTAYIYRSYHAIKGLRNSSGFPTNAIFGFTNTLMKIIKEKEPWGIAVCFDHKEPTHRHKLFPLYKANRAAPDEDMIKQIEPIYNIVKAFNVAAFIMPGVEADDILATLARRASDQGFSVYIVTSDKDMLQVISQSIKIYNPTKEIVLDENSVIERFAVPPQRIPEIMALTGDQSDNIPGVKGIGEKTAVDLLKDFGSLDDLMRHHDRIKNKRISNLIAENIENIKLSKTLTTIDFRVPIETDIASLALQRPNHVKLKEYFKEYEFFSLLKLLPDDTPLQISAEIITSYDELEQATYGIREISINAHLNASNATLKGISFCSQNGKGYYIGLENLDAITEQKIKTKRFSISDNGALPILF